MKRILIVSAALLVFASCNDAAKTSEEAGEVKTASTEAATLNIDKALSVVKWEGAKMAESAHSGTVDISEGSFSVKDGKLEAGTFTIDLTTINNSDIADTAMRAKLLGHLKSADFFMTDSFPNARFDVTAVAPGSVADSATITGNLTIKGITNGVTFPAKLSVSDSTVDASARITINRNEWGIIWGGTKTEKSIKDYLKNNLIKDEITFDVNLKGTK